MGLVVGRGCEPAWPPQFMPVQPVSGNLAARPPEISVLLKRLGICANFWRNTAFNKRSVKFAALCCKPAFDVTSRS